MHSRVYQMSKDKEALKECDIMKAIDLARYLENGSDGAKLLCGEVEVAESWEWLINFSKGSLKDCGEYIEVVDRDLFLRERYDLYNELLEKINEKNTYDNFVKSTSGIRWDLLDLINTFNDRNGFLILDEENNLNTFEGFLRSSENGDKLYKGVVYDYHF